ncbi:MAG: hypothetical protein GY862_03770 [Gammaproteobacteria bacterium]|nr:hypothetical protein [Gammaproteobacteria bacterium]
MPGTVSNSTPLIHLAKIGKLELLRDFFGTVLIPQAVFNECVAEGRGYEDATLLAQVQWLMVKPASDTNLVKLLNMDLDRGEAEAIVLALK